MPPEALAKALGISDATLAKLEAMPRVSAGALAGYAAGLGVRVEVELANGRRIEVKP